MSSRFVEAQIGIAYQNPETEQGLDSFLTVSWFPECEEIILWSLQGVF